jgi:hypothetical protein
MIKISFKTPASFPLVAGGTVGKLGLALSLQPRWLATVPRRPGRPCSRTLRPGHVGGWCGRFPSSPAIQGRGEGQGQMPQTESRVLVTLTLGKRELGVATPRETSFCLYVY